jgi:hypothetical protein
MLFAFLASLHYLYVVLPCSCGGKKAVVNGVCSTDDFDILVLFLQDLSSSTLKAMPMDCQSCCTIKTHGPG